MDKEIIIYKDIEGNYDINCYYQEEDLGKLKNFLYSLGVKEIDIMDDNLSIERQRPFVSEKPRVMKKKTKKINYAKKEVIIEMLCSREQDDDEKCKQLCLLSGFDMDELDEYEKPSGFISPAYADLSKKYEKWKRENNITETPETKKKLVGDFSEVHILEVKKKKQKRLQEGTKVIDNVFKDEWLIEKYNEKEGSYDVKSSEGSSSTFKRNQLEVIPK